MAKIWAGKFDIISPVWLQVLRRGNSYEIGGTHDIDLGWIKDVRTSGPGNTKCN